MARAWSILGAQRSLAALAILLAFAGRSAHSGDGGLLAGDGHVRNTAVAFANVNASNGAAFVTTGAKLAPFSGLDRPGLRLLYAFGTKLQEEDPLVDRAFHRFTGGRVFAGHEWHWGRLAVSAYAGASLSMHTPWERAITRYEGRLGIAALLEFWQSWHGHRRWPDGFTSGTLLADAAEGSFYLRLRQGFATGWRETTIGPEIAISAGRRRQVGWLIGRESWFDTRLGLHAGGLTFGNFGLGAAAGYETGRRQGGAAYAEITALYTY